MTKITPFLWFDDQAEEAMNFYTSVFKNSKITNISRNGDKVFSGSFTLDGQDFFALNGGPLFKFNESISFFVNCETQEEVDYFWEKLSAGGEESQCGWLKDKFGASWQIVPSMLGEVLNGSDPVGSQRTRQAMLQMSKLDIAKLRKAYEG
jgi:predicted 3-demethylubiquinone-9 3-methyltransferase (glyoxalase superfamily)